MSFKPIRSFLANRLIEVDSDFESHNQPFSLDNIGANDFNKRFHIFYGQVATSVSNQVTTSDDVTATVTLSFNGFRDDSEALDEAMDIANLYRINCLRLEKLNGQSFIKRVVCENITAQPVDTNDNSILITLQFKIKVIFGLGLNLDC